jgi:hypothetical protein
MPLGNMSWGLNGISNNSLFSGTIGAVEGVTSVSANDGKCLSSTKIGVVEVAGVGLAGLFADAGAGAGLDAGADAGLDAGAFLNLFLFRYK